MPLSSPNRTSFGPILLAIQTQLATDTGLDPSAIKLIGRDNRSIPKLTGEQDILIRPSGFLVPGLDGGEQEAAGRVSTRIRRRIYIFPRVRMILDQIDRDDIWLTDSVNGIFALEDKILGGPDGLSGLDEFFPLDSSGNQLTIWGLKLTDGEGPEKYLAPSPEWGSSSITFLAVYHPLILPGSYGLGG